MLGQPTMGAGGSWFAVDGGGTSYKTNRSSAIAGLCIAVVLLVGFVTLLSMYFCSRTRRPVPPSSSPTPRRREGDYDDDGIEVGIDEATLQALPLVLYGAAAAQTCCAVCLESYGDSDVLRVLPDCGHLFHRKCIFTWLWRRPTCPVCRTSPLPSPTRTPLAEVLGLLYV